MTFILLCIHRLAKRFIIIPSFNDLLSNLVTTSYKKRSWGSLIIFALLIFVGRRAGNTPGVAAGGRARGGWVSVLPTRLSRRPARRSPGHREPQQDATDPGRAARTRRWRTRGPRTSYRGRRIRYNPARDIGFCGEDMPRHLVSGLTRAPIGYSRTNTRRCVYVGGGGSVSSPLPCYLPNYWTDSRSENGM